MNEAWQLQTAKSKFSQLVDEAREFGPQIVTRRGHEVVVVVAIEEWRKLRPQRTFKELLLAAPIEGLDLSRDKSPMRDVDL